MPVTESAVFFNIAFVFMKPNIKSHFFVQPGSPDGWRTVFLISAIIYIACATFYNVFGSATELPWNDPESSKTSNERLESVQTISETSL